MAASDPLLARRIAAAMARIAVLASGTPDRAALAAMLDEVLALAAGIDAAAFPASGGARRYLLHACPDGGPALQLNALRPPWGMPPHDHATWAVLAGVAGVERHRLYRRDGAALAPAGEAEVRPGRGLILLPDEIHSVELGPAPVLSLHLYGVAPERQRGRTVFAAPRDD
jgi:predicted metal-dependent enzyme (double-stranded beta helix superfamily)